MEPIRAQGNLIAGRFRPPSSPDDVIEKRNPGDLSDVIGIFPSSAEDVDHAVESAAKALLSWTRRPFEERRAAVEKFNGVLEAESGRLAALITRETGKPLWESKMEISSVAKKIEITIRRAMPLIKGERVGEGAETRPRARGVLAVLGPFNLPAHLPHGHIVPALLAGNTVVFKPSEKTPAVGELYASLWVAAGLPPGVVNMVQGKGDAGAQLASHSGVGGVLFTGSYSTGRRLM
ncbi:MAG: aldehyde dehydrogenase family protein, partial [Vicinamibacteria bacterium]